MVSETPTTSPFDEGLIDPRDATSPFVYGLVDPQDVGHVRYVGMAMRAQRPFDHAKNARRTVKHSYLLHWIRSIQAEGREPAHLILEQLAPGTPAKFVGLVERMYISSLRQIGHRLTNVTEGGWGGNDSPRSIETRAKISAASTGRSHSAGARAKISAALKGHIHSVETIAKLSVARKRYWASAENHVKMSATHKNPSVETREKISAAQRGRPRSAETRAKISATTKGKVFSAETRAKISTAGKQYWVLKRAGDAAREIDDSPIASVMGEG